MGWRCRFGNRAGVIFGQVGEVEEVMAEDGLIDAIQDEDEAAVGVAIPEDGVDMDVIAAEKEAERGEFLVGGEQVVVFSAGTEVIG